MPNRPGVYATGEDRGVRPYGRPLSPADFYNPASGSYDARPEWLGPAGRPAVVPEIGQRTADLVESGDVLSTMAPVLPGGQPFTGPRSRYDELLGGSRQAYTMGIDRGIEDAPYEAAERQRTASEGAALMDMANEERQQQAGAEAEAIHSQGVMAGINQVLESPIGKLIQSQLANQQMPMSANSPFALPQRKAGAEDIRSKVDLKGSYTQNAPTYTAPKSGGDIGTIDLRADAPKQVQMNPEQVFGQYALAAAQAGNADAAKKFADIELAYRGRGMADAELENKQVSTEKMRAEIDKLEKEMEAGTDSVSTERLMIVNSQAVGSYDDYRKSMFEAMLKMPANANLSEEEAKLLAEQVDQTSYAAWAAQPQNEVFVKAMGMTADRLREADSATSKADQKIAKSKPPTDRLTKRAE